MESTQGRRRPWRTGLLLTAIVTVVGPFAFGPPAEAATNSAYKEGFLTFVTYSGTTVTCWLQGFNDHTTDTQTANGTSYARRYPDGNFVPDCRAHLEMRVFYKDTDGDERQLLTYDYDADNLNLFIYGVGGNVRITHTATFTNCNINQSATCTLSVQTATK